MDTQCSRLYDYELSLVKRNGSCIQKLIFMMLLAILKKASLLSKKKREIAKVSGTTVPIFRRLKKG